MGRGSPLGENLRERIVTLFRSNVSQSAIAKYFRLSSSTVHNIIKRFKESGGVSVRRGQGRKPTLDAQELRLLRVHCLANRHDSINEVTLWAKERFGKTLSANTVRRCLHKCNLKRCLLETPAELPPPLPPPKKKKKKKKPKQAKKPRRSKRKSLSPPTSPEGSSSDKD